MKEVVFLDVRKSCETQSRDVKMLHVGPCWTMSTSECSSCPTVISNLSPETIFLCFSVWINANAPLSFSDGC